MGVRPGKFYLRVARGQSTREELLVKHMDVSLSPFFPSLWDKDDEALQGRNRNWYGPRSRGCDWSQRSINGIITEMANLLELDLEISEPRAAVVRDLTLNDRMDLPRGSESVPIAKLRDTHHLLARCLASGMKDVEAHAVTGYSQSRISILKRDPTFAGLVDHYREHVNDLYFDLHARMAAMAGDVLTELRERFEDKPEGFTSAFLANLLVQFADRTQSKAKKNQSEDMPSLPLTMDLAKLDPDERAQVRQMIEKRIST